MNDSKVIPASMVKDLCAIIMDTIGLAKDERMLSPRTT